MSSGPPPAIPYTKPWLSIPDQVLKLEHRGLQIDDRPAAESFLRHVNYYRFTGYCLAFQDASWKFATGVTFEQIQFACAFDATLRDLFTEALELIEIDLRTSVAHFFGQKYGAFGHMNAARFHPKFDYNITHVEWLKKLRDETKRSNELFVQHFRRNYREFPDLPIWVVTETMSFGSLSRMIGGLYKHDRQDIATDYGISPKVFARLTHHFAYVRNLCAHHSRLWDRIWSIKPSLIDAPEWKPPWVPSNQRLFSTLLLMQHMLSHIPYAASENVAWRNRVTKLLQTPPAVIAPNRLMGLTITWDQHPVWKV